MNRTSRSTSRPARKSTREKAAELRRLQERRERRRTILTVGGAVLVAVALVGGVAFGIARNRPTPGPPEGVVAYDKPPLERGHVEGPVEYRQTPPVGGKHAPVWQNCGVYTEPVVKEQAVHSLEHGAVWLTYRPDLPADQVRTLQQLTRDQTFVVLSPNADLPSPVVATAWARQLPLQTANEKAITSFIRAFQVGPTTPEPGAPCTGGVGNPQ